MLLRTHCVRRFSLAIVVTILLYLLWNNSDFKSRQNPSMIFVETQYSRNKSSYLFHVDDRLFMREPTFSLPSDTLNIFHRIPFQIFLNNQSGNMQDRIYNQMRYVPSEYLEHKDTLKEKVIVVYDMKTYLYFGDFRICPVSKCRISTDLKMAPTADVLLWIDRIYIPSHRRPSNQSWAILFLESPMHTPIVESFEQKAKSKINWTLTYRPDSTLEYPYQKYSPYDLSNPPPDRYPLPTKNYALGKTKMAASFSSNCVPSNNRKEVIQDIQRFIQVDVYGKCGTLNCAKDNQQSCFDMLNKDYKFYFAFENSYCRYYITEKFFVNGLSHNVIPVVLGAHPDDYKRVAPPHSFIHIEQFKSIELLSQYLKYLDKNDTAYNEYFAWKSFGTVDFQHHFYCRLCMLAHEEKVKTFYTNIHDWWHSGMCFTSGRWTN